MTMKKLTQAMMKHRYSLSKMVITCCQLEQEIEQDGETKDKDFGQAVNPSNKDCESKLLEATKQLSSTKQCCLKQQNNYQKQQTNCRIQNPNCQQQITS